MNIGISGAEGSFSEQAANVYIQKNNIADASINYLVSVENVLSELEAGTIDTGIFPIENSNGGIVIEAVYAMAQHRFQVEKLFEIEVSHCLLVQPGTHASSITTISSHDQALKQCRMYLKRSWPGVELMEYADTAKAAKDLAAGTLSATTAVIAPKRCAELYGLEVLEEGIQDLKFNFTTFIVGKKI